MTPRKTLIFGLDGFDFAYATRLASQGRMPCFQSLLNRGSLIETRCSVLPGSEWVNAACGVSPAGHGYLHTTQLRLGTYELVATDAGVVTAPPFYLPLAQAGHKTVIVDLCVDRPRPSPHLLQVIDWATEFKLWKYATTPPSLGRFVDGVCPGHVLTRYPGTDPREANLLGLRDRLLTGTELKGRLIRELMQAHPDWQVLFAGFSEAHKSGHFYWQFQDPDHPGFRHGNHPLAGAMAAHYEALDRELSAIVADLTEPVNVITVADRGMRANFRGDHLIVPLLERLGLLAPARPGTSGKAPRHHGDAGGGEVRSAAGRRWKDRLPVALRPLVRRLLGRQLYDWGRTQVFPIPEVGNTYLRVNLRGREPRGTVPLASYDRLLDRLEEEFSRLVNPLTGTCPVREVVFPQRAFAGPVQHQLPDIGIVWRGDAPLSCVESPSIGRLEGTRIEQRSGNHSERGAMLFSGPDFTRGTQRQGDLRELAPTLLALHGLPIPAHYDFEPAAELRR